MCSDLPEKMSFCKCFKKWIICEIPKKCKQYISCEDCEFHEVRLLNDYIKKKLRKLRKENE